MVPIQVWAVCEGERPGPRDGGMAGGLQSPWGSTGPERPARAGARLAAGARLRWAAAGAAAGLVLVGGGRWAGLGAGGPPGGLLAVPAYLEPGASGPGASGPGAREQRGGAAGGGGAAGSSREVDGDTGWPAPPARPEGRSAKDSPAWDGFTFPGCQPEEWDERIRDMLAPWAEAGGIRRDTVWKGVREYGIGCVPMPGEDPLGCVRPSSTHAGVGLGFYKGKAYLLEDNLNFRTEAGQIVMGHLQNMLELEKLDIPDVEFLLFGTDASFDLSRKKTEEGQPRSAAEIPPVMHYCTYPDLFAELLVPGDFWFHIQDFDRRMAAFASEAAPISGAVARDFWKPWHEREEVLACNCGGYHRYDVDPEHPWRALGGQKGTETHCAPETDDSESQDLQCPSPRMYYENFLSQKWRPDLLKSQVLSNKLEEWDTVKYILFMDGITCSTRLQQYLNLGMSTFIEESGYQQYFQPLLKPWKHYVPVWNQTADQGPEDLVEKVELAKAHDAEAKALGENAYAFADSTFKPERRLCYWETLLKAYAHLQTTPPKKPDWAVRVRDHLTSRPGCGEVNGLHWHHYNEAYKVGAAYGKESWAPDSEFCHPAASAYDHVADPCPGGIDVLHGTCLA